MSSWRVHWCINDCGLTIIDAETEAEARKKFLDMKLRHVLRADESRPCTGLCLTMEKITKRKERGG